MLRHAIFITLVFFLLLSFLGNVFEISGVRSASLWTYAIFLLYVVSFIVGYFFFSYSSGKEDVHYVYCNKVILFSKIKLLIIVVFLFMMFCLFLSGAFHMTPYEYFLSQRGSSIIAKSGTGYPALENFIQLIVQPFIISLNIFTIACLIKAKSFSATFSFFSFLLSCVYTYFYQANTTIVLMMFSFLIASIHLYTCKTYPFLNRKKAISVIFILVLCFVLFIAVNRFGNNDILGALLYYPATYFSISFSIFDYYFHNNSSILYSHTYGESILGYISVIFSLLLRAGGDSFTYISASVQNVTNNANFIDLGIESAKNVNAFGSVLFTAFRDYGLFGVNFIGFAFGSILAILRLRSNSLLGMSLYIYIAIMILMSFTVSPFDLPYFWAVFIMLFLLSKQSRLN